MLHNKKKCYKGYVDDKTGKMYDKLGFIRSPGPQGKNLKSVRFSVNNGILFK